MYRSQRVGESTDVNLWVGPHSWIHGAPYEVDPNNKRKSKTPTPELPAREILMEYDDNAEIIQIDMEADNSHLSAETVNMPPGSLAQTETVTVWKVPLLKRKTVRNGPTKLEKAAQSYSQSTEQMALAVREMAKAISQLAEAFYKIADAVKNQVSSD